MDDREKLNHYALEVHSGLIQNGFARLTRCAYFAKNWGAGYGGILPKREERVMVLNLLAKPVIDTRLWKVIDIQTWQAYLQVFVQENDGKRLVGILVELFPFEDPSQFIDLAPHTSVEIKILDDERMSIEPRSGV